MYFIKQSLFGRLVPFENVSTFRFGFAFNAGSGNQTVLGSSLGLGHSLDRRQQPRAIPDIPTKMKKGRRSNGGSSQESVHDGAGSGVGAASSVLAISRQKVELDLEILRVMDTYH